MTTLQEAAAKAIEYAEAMCGGRCNAEYNPCHAYEIADCLRTALAQQELPAEPTDDQLVKGVKAMRLFVTKNSVADFKLGYMAALAAAPAPQAQDKSDNYLSGYCTGRTDLLKEQSAQPVAQPLTDDQIKSMWAQYCGYPGGILDFARAVRGVK